MTSALTNDSTTSIHTPSRRLTDDVLQSAENAVLTNPASVEEVLPRMARAFYPPPSERGWQGSRDAFVHHVARQPVRSALMAAAAGALAAVIVRSIGKSRRR